jgi:hypothetical protein
LRLLPRILADEDELDRLPDVGPGSLTKSTSEPPAETPIGPPRPLVVGVFVTALAVRLGYLFVFTDPENAGHGFTDAYHHWQIAYLTKEIGLSHGPRLWDLRGWEYYWGLLHPVLMDITFFVTGSPDIVLARLLSAMFGSLAVLMIFLLCHRYWGLKVAISATAVASFAPAAVFNDTAGMAEPIAVFLVLLGIWLTPRHGFWSGIAWGLAAMARVEAWLFGAGLVVAWLVGRRRARGTWWLVGGWVLVMGLYAKFLLDSTGNPVYPFYWSFLFVAFGAFDSSPVLSAAQESLRIPLALATAASAAGLAWSLWKRPSSYLLLVYGFGYSAYSFATFLKVDDWKERRFELPLDFAAILAAVLLFKVVPRWRPNLEPMAWATAVIAVFAIQGFWIPIQTAYAATETGFQDQVRLGQEIGAVYNRPEYRGGVLTMPGDEPTLLYTMVRYGGVPGSRVASEFYDPFYYLPAGYHYVDHKDIAGPLLQCWFSSTRTRLLILPPESPFNHSVQEYEAFMADHPGWFSDTQTPLGYGLRLIAVQVRDPGSAVCAAAARNAPR